MNIFKREDKMFEKMGKFVKHIDFFKKMKYSNYRKKHDEIVNKPKKRTHKCDCGFFCTMYYLNNLRIK